MKHWTTKERCFFKEARQPQYFCARVYVCAKHQIPLPQQAITWAKHNAQNIRLHILMLQQCSLKRKKKKKNVGHVAPLGGATWKSFEAENERRQKTVLQWNAVIRGVWRHRENVWHRLWPWTNISPVYVVVLKREKRKEKRENNTLLPMRSHQMPVQNSLTIKRPNY